MRKAMKQKFIKTITALVIFGLLKPSFSEYTLTSFALLEYTAANCAETMTPYLEWRKLEFAIFLDTHFESKENNSSLVDGAIQAFIEFKKMTTAELGKFKTGNLDVETEFKGYNACIKLVDQTIEEARDKLREKVLTNGKIKAATVLLEKYKAISKQLAEMNTLISKVIAGFETIKNKLPGYLRSCVTK